MAEYLASDPVRVRADGGRDAIVILPLGDFDEHHLSRRLLDLTSEFMGLFFGLPVRVERAVPLGSVPESARRVHPEWGDRQILTTWVLYTLLGRRLPPDAATYLCLTTSDLWPGRDWNFVFGMASLKKRVGVWSLYRKGDPSGGEREFRTCLRRVLGTATHETGHMFGMKHCTAYSCGMCGSNSLEESDRRPIHFCPECTPKVAWATGVDLVDRAHRLAAFCTRTGLLDEANYYSRSAEQIASVVDDDDDDDDDLSRAIDLRLHI